MQLPQSQVTFSNFHFLDMKAQNICPTVNLNAYLSLQQLYRHFAYNLVPSLRPWKLFASWVNIHQMHRFCLELSQTVGTPSSPSDSAQLWPARVPRLRGVHASGLHLPVARSLHSQRPDPGGRWFQTLAGNHGKGLMFRLGSVLDSHLVRRRAEKQ